MNRHPSKTFSGEQFLMYKISLHPSPQQDSFSQKEMAVNKGHVFSFGTHKAGIFDMQSPVLAKV